MEQRHKSPRLTGSAGEYYSSASTIPPAYSHDDATALSEDKVDHYLDYCSNKSGDKMEEEVEGQDQEGSTCSSNKERSLCGRTKVPNDMPADQRPVIEPKGDR